MTASTLLTRLYPPAVRERWGTEISREVSEAGIRCWPDTLAGAVRLWLHPSDWPETFAGQTRRVVLAALFAVTAVTGLLLRATQPSATLTADVHHPVTSLWIAPLLLGIGLAAPPPPLRWNELRRLATEATRTLAIPAVAFLAMVIIAHSRAIEHLGSFAHTALIVYYWATLGLTAFRLYTLVVRVARNSTIPTTRRLRSALLLIGTGLALAAGQGLLAIAQTTTPHAGPLALSLALGIAATATIHAGHDLRGTDT